MPSPNSTFQRNVTFVSPDLGDLFFWEYETFSRVEFTDLENHPRFAYGTRHHSPDKYPEHEVVYIQHDPDYDARGFQDSQRCKVFYARVRDDQDQYNFSFATTNLGGTDFNTVQRTYVIKREEFSETSPAIGSPMPRDPDNKFSEGYVLLERQETDINLKELRSLYVTETRVYIKVETITSVVADDFFGGSLSTVRTLFYRGQDYEGAPIEDQVGVASNWGIKSDGKNREVTQLSDDWWAVTVTDVVPSEGATRTYTEFRNYSWPAIISANSFRFVVAPRKDGSTVTRVSVTPDKEAYSGTTRFRVTQVWSSTPVGTTATPIIFDTQSASYSGVQFSTSFGNALVNGNITVIDNIGSGDPTFERGTYGLDPWVLSSTQTSWGSGAQVVSVRQENFRGGWLRTTLEAFPPY